MKKKILVLGKHKLRNKRELARLVDAHQYDFIFNDAINKRLESFYHVHMPIHDYGAYVEYVIRELKNLFSQERCVGIISTSDAINSVKNAVSEELGLPGPSLKTILQLEHKYYARCLQEQKAIDVMYYKAFNTIEDCIERYTGPFPFIIKPIKSNFGQNVHVINDKQALKKCTHSMFMPNGYHLPLDYLFLRTGMHASSQGLLAEQFIQGDQVTVDGFVYNRAVYILGVVDSIMFPGTISFQRFEYPSSLERHIQEKIVNRVKRFMQSIDFDNGLFNVECIYSRAQEKVYFIEINPRISSQFADLYEKVDGFNTYQILVDLALGNKPTAQKNNGRFNVAASFVMRTFQDYYLVALPQESQVQALKKEFPEIRIEFCAKPGEKLSESIQDGKSYRYCLVHLGAENRQELYEKFSYCKAKLSFTLQSIPA